MAVAGGWKETTNPKRPYRHADSEIIPYVVFGAEPAPLADVAQLVEQLPCKRGQQSRFSQESSISAGSSPSLVYETVYVRPLWGSERAQ